MMNNLRVCCRLVFDYEHNSYNRRNITTGPTVRREYKQNNTNPRNHTLASTKSMRDPTDRTL